MFDALSTNMLLLRDKKRQGLNTSADDFFDEDKVDRFLGEKELVVQTLDPRLGKVKDISSGAVMENGSPVLIVDVEDLIRSVDKLAGDGTLERIRTEYCGEYSGAGVSTDTVRAAWYFEDNAAGWATDNVRVRRTRP